MNHPPDPNQTVTNPYDPPRAASGDTASHSNKGIAVLRGVGAAVIGSQIGSFAAMGLNLRDWMWVAVVLVMLACVVYGRNRLLILLVLSVLTWIAGETYSRHRVTQFCESITAATSPAELPRLASQANVDFRSNAKPDASGQFYGRAADLFTMGDFSCRVHFDKDRIISSRAYTH